MPKIKSYTPAWLSRPAPGHDLFAPGPATPARSPSSLPASYPPKANDARSAARRTIVRRGTEVFIAVGKEIRWADLVYLKEQWQARAAAAAGGRSGVRLKREDSADSYDELLRLSAHDGFAQGFRVGNSRRGRGRVR